MVEIVTADRVLIAGLVLNADQDLQDQKAKIADQDRKAKTAGLVLNADQDLQDQKEKIADQDRQDQKDKIARQDLRDRKVKTADRVQRDKIVQKDQLQQLMVAQPLRNHSKRKRSLNQDLLEMVQRLPLKLSLGLIFLFELLFFACSDSNVVLDETATFDESGWIQKQPIHFNVEVADSVSLYTAYVVVRQNNAYPFYNLYFSPSIVDAQGKTIQKGLAEAILYDPKTGKPKGAGFGDIYEKKFLIYRALHFPKPGKYAIYVAQSMRVDTLAGMVSFGIRLEKNDRK
jgi:gliding motility-associated lipoprotein GldH